MNIKRQKKDQNVKVNLSVEINKLSERTLVTVVDTFRLVMESNVSAVKAVGEMIKGNVHMMGKMVDAMTRLRHPMDDNERTHRSELTGENTKRAKSWKDVLITTGGDRRRGKVMTERERPTGEKKETEKSMVEGRRRRR